MKNTHTATLKHSHKNIERTIEVRETKRYYLWGNIKFNKSQLVQNGECWIFFYLENVQPIRAV